MKDLKYFFIVIMFLIITNIYTQENEDTNYENVFGFQFGTIDFFMNINDNISFDFSTNLAYFMFINGKTKLGFELDTIRYWYINSTNENILSYGGITLFWNIIKQPLFFGVFGPFISLNIFNTYEFTYFSLNKTIISTGIRYFIYLPTFRLIGFEGGYRNIHGNHAFYIGIQIINPIILPLMFFQ